MEGPSPGGAAAVGVAAAVEAGSAAGSEEGIRYIVVETAAVVGVTAVAAVAAARENQCTVAGAVPRGIRWPVVEAANYRMEKAGQRSRSAEEQSLLAGVAALAAAVVHEGIASMKAVAAA